VGAIVAAADGIVERGARAGHRRADAGLIGRAAERLGRVAAELTLGAREAEEAAARDLRLFALAGVDDRDARARSLTRVAVRAAVAAADRVVEGRADLGAERAGA